MLRHELLRRLHRLVRPRTYLEIGVNRGHSLALSRSPSIGIDPMYQVRAELRCDVQLARMTSDEFFAVDEPLAHFPQPIVDLAFIDGMHLAEYALRDFVNVERYTTPTSVIVFDDVLPGSADEAARDRHTVRWTGDVYKVVQALRRHRPDLLCLEVDTQPTGTALVLLPDAHDPVLRERYDDLVEDFVVEDPQRPPVEVTSRSRAVDPRRLVRSSVWPHLVSLRDRRRQPSAAKLRAVLVADGLSLPAAGNAGRPAARTSAAGDLT